jgi:hypothetical protein
MAGKSLKKVLDIFTTGWTNEEKTKTLTGVVFGTQVTEVAPEVKEEELHGRLW